MTSGSPADYQTYQSKMALFARDPQVAARRLQQMNEADLIVYAHQTLAACLAAGCLDTVRQLVCAYPSLDPLESREMVPALRARVKGLGDWVMDTYSDRNHQILDLAIQAGRADMVGKLERLLERGDTVRFQMAVQSGDLETVRRVFSRTGAYDADLREGLAIAPRYTTEVGLLSWLAGECESGVRTVDPHPDRALAAAIQRGDVEQVSWLARQYPEAELCSRTDRARGPVGHHSTVLEELRWMLRAYPTGGYELLSAHMEMLGAVIQSRTGWTPRGFPAGLEGQWSQEVLERWVRDSRADWSPEATLDWPLLWAMEVGAEEIVEWISQEGGAGEDDRADMEFAWICGQGHRDLAGYYLRQIPAIEVGSYGGLAYRLAARGDQREIMELLERRDRRLTTEKTIREGALRLALASGASEAVAHLLSSGQVDLPSILQDRIWCQGHLAGHLRTLETLRARLGTAGLGPYASHVFGELCAAGDLRTADRLIRTYPVDPEAYGRRALRMALGQGQIGAVRLLGGESQIRRLETEELAEIAGMAAEAGEVHALRLLHGRSGWTEAAMVGAARGDRIHILAHLLRHEGVTDLGPAYQAAHYAGSLASLRWMLGLRRGLPEGLPAALAAIEGGQLPALRHALQTHRDLDLSTLIQAAAARAIEDGDRRVVHWLTAEYGNGLLDEQLIVPLARCGEYDWLQEMALEREDIFMSQVYDVLEDACHGGDEQTCRVLGTAYPQLKRPSARTVYGAAEGGHLAVLDWIQSECEVEGLDPEELLLSACKSGDWKTADWVASGHLEHDFSRAEECLVAAASRGDLHLMRWLGASFGGLDWNYGDGLALAQAAAGGHRRACELLLSRGVLPTSRAGLPYALACQNRNQTIRRLLERQAGSGDIQLYTRGDTAAVLSAQPLSPEYEHQAAEIGGRHVYLLAGTLDGVRRGLMTGRQSPEERHPVGGSKWRAI